MGSVSQYSATTANALLDLVDIAGGDLSQAYLPANLNLVTTFANGSVTSGGGQGLLATGTVAGIDGPVAVLAVGVDWPAFISFFEQSFLATTTPPPYLNAGGNDSLIAQGYSLAYNAIHTQIWAAVAKLKLVPGYASNVPLLVVGMGPAGPLAQMAALDLRPGQTGPDGSGGSMTSPVGAAGCYSFSTPAYGNASYAAAVTAALGSVFLCNLDGIDFYPSIAGAPTGFAYSGAVQTLSASVPTTSDVPWLERTPAFYQTAYGAPQPQLAGGGTVTPVSGYSGDLAYTLALLTTATYGRFQHPDLSQPLPSGYTRAADVAVNGVVWASIYSSGDRTVVASRGACSWIELLAFMGNGSLLPLPWFTSGGRILQGLYSFYPGYAAALFTALSAVPGVAGKPLVFAGHDFGGALAALAAYNLALVPYGGIPAAAAAAVYGFGTVRFGDYAFQSAYQSALGSVSYQILRPNDVIAANPGLSLMASLPTTMRLSGGMLSPVNSTTGHALALYTSLLNPQASAGAQSFAAVQPAALPANARRLGLLAATAAPRIVAAGGPELTPFLSRMVEFYGLHPGHLAGPVLDTADHHGRIVLSADPKVSSVAPAQVFAGGSRVFATSPIIVRAGQTLHVGSPGSPPLRLVAHSILLEPGAALSVESSAHLAVGSMTSMAASAAATPNIIVQGANGANGRPGYQGPTGASGAPGYPGGNGGTGQNGGWGANGVLPSPFTFSVGTISGTFIVRVVGGQGGDGGQGGAGGAGGSGGSGAAGGRGGTGGTGGNGGNGANGTAIVIKYDTMDPGTTVVFQDFGGLRGAGGASGAGGPGGAGQPPGTSGISGNPGLPGQPGTPSTLQFIPSSS